MSQEEPTYGELLVEAFNVKVPIPGLGGMPLNWLGLATFGVLGLVNPGFWLVGAALETVLLFGLAQSPRFRSFVKGKRLVAAKEAVKSSWSDRAEQVLEDLPDDAGVRYRSLVARCERVADISRREDYAGFVGSMAEEGLERLQRIFLGLLQTQAALETELDKDRIEPLKMELDAKVRDLESQSGGDPRIIRSLESTIDLLRRRITNLEGATSNVAYIKSELRRIEHQAELLIEEAALARSPDQLAGKIDAVTATFDETAEWMRTHKDLVGDAEVELEAPRRIPPSVRQGVKR